MRQHRFTQSQLLAAMTKVDGQARAMPRPLSCGTIFLLALHDLFLGRGIRHEWLSRGPDIRMAPPARWWRDKATGDLVVQQGIDVRV